MLNETHVSDLIPAYALGCLDEDEDILVSEHLPTCSACQAELEVYQTVTDRLAFTALDASPSADLKRQLMDRVQPAHPPATAAPRQSWWEQLTSLWHRAAPAWGAVSLVIILALAVSNLMLRQQVNESTAESGGMRVVRLSGTDAAQDAAGTLVVSADGEYGTLVVDGLPLLDDGHQYQLWLIRDGQRTDGGVFSVNDEGYGALWISSPSPLSSYPAFGVTIEPAGGSPGPTGDKVLGGSL